MKLIEMLLAFAPRVTCKIFPARLTRPMVQYIKNNNMNRSLVGCEIGVMYGDNALNMLLNLPLERLYLIDPNLYKARNRLKKFNHKIVELPWRSDIAVSNIADESLDFCYIDGDHSYEGVKRDIELYYPKLKWGGVLGGHDFSGTFLGVIRAVLEFESMNDLCVCTSLTDWWAIKYERK